MTTPLFLDPIDVWLFRDGKPFDAGADHHADSLFPPPPSVIQGAVRSHHLVMKGIDLARANASRIAREVGTATDFLDLRIRGPFIRRGEQAYFSLPADVFLDSATGSFRALTPRPLKAGEESSNPLPLSLFTDGAHPAKHVPGFVSQAEWKNYVSGKPFSATPAGDLFEAEGRVGIAQDDRKRVAKDGALYSVNFVRPRENVGLHVEVDGFADWGSKTGAMRIGGEGHGARFAPSSLRTPLPSAEIGKRRKFKLVLLTPTYFSRGWTPHDWSSQFTGPVKLQAAALRRFTSLGGFDWANGDHKPALRYVPSGSVYYFSCAEDVELKNRWLCEPLADGAPIGKIGYGQVAVADW